MYKKTFHQKTSAKMQEKTSLGKNAQNWKKKVHYGKEKSQKCKNKFS
jgi:hypothetical protein